MLKKNDLIEYFFKGIKDRNNLKIGVEHEKFVLSKKNFHQVSYDIKNGIKDKRLSKLNFNQLKKKNFRKNKMNKIKFIFVACSSLSAQKQAIEFAGNNTSINFFAGLKKYKGLDPMLQVNTNKIHYKQLKIIGSHGSKFRHLKKAGDLIINKKIRINKIISHVFNIKNYKQAFQKLISGKFIKIIVKPNLK